MEPTGSITKVDFAVPHLLLRRYISSYYFAEVESICGNAINDLLHPEWGSVRYLCDGALQGNVFQAEPVSMPPVILVGPTSRATSISCVKMRIVSFGLLPLGWHRFIGRNASEFADQAAELADVPGVEGFGTLLPQLKAAGSNISEIAAILDTALLAALNAKGQIAAEEEESIEAAHRALADPETATVAQMAGKLGITTLQLERMSKRVFGFAPKLLLRRQRFLRTLAMVITEPRSKWAEVLDPQYYDQAHFNRDFQRFFGMSPRDYMAMPRPIVAAAALERMRKMGGALQGLHLPSGDRADEAAA